MTFDTKILVSGARCWLESGGLGLGRACDGTSADIDTLSDEVRILLAVPGGDERCAIRAGTLFDQLASKAFPPDVFGERYEVAATLAFLGWRHSYLQGHELESVKWLGVIDCLVQEDSADLERLAIFLFLPPNQQSEELCTSLLQSSVDVFLSLAILRRDRFRKPQEVIAAAALLYAWLRGGPTQIEPTEAEFFRSESAWIASSCLRMLGRGIESRSWLAIARKLRRRVRCGEVLRAKLHLVRLIEDRELHRHRHLAVRLESLRNRFTQWEMDREALICRLIVALVEATVGENESALKRFDDIYDYCKQGAYGNISGLALSLAAEIRMRRGENISEAVFQEALDLARDTGDIMTIASLILHAGGARFSQGRHGEAAHFYALAAEQFQQSGCEHWHGYARILLAEALIGLGRLDDALESLLIGIPILNQERPKFEAIHALKLLGLVSARPTDSPVAAELRFRN